MPTKQNELKTRTTEMCEPHKSAHSFNKVIKINHSNDNRVTQPPYNKRNEYSLDKNRIKKYRTATESMNVAGT